MTNPFGVDLEVLAEALKMKNDGASNTQIRAYLEEHGITGIKFDNDDIGEIGTLPDMSDAEKELCIRMSSLFKTPSVPFDLPLIRQRQHFGVLSQLNPSDQPQRNMPDKSVGESEYIRPEDRDALLSGYSPEEQMGLKLPDELAQRLKNMNFDQAPSPVSPEFAADMEKMRDVQSQAILANLEAAGAENAGIGPRGTISFMNPPFSAPFKRFAPVFDAAVARRHIYKDLLNRMNEEIEQGPLAGIVFFTGVTNGLPHIAPAQFVFSVTWTHKARNRMKAYNTYFTNLRIKYMQEIAETDAAEEKKVMERE